MRRQLGQIELVFAAIFFSLPVQAENYAFLVAVQDYDVKTLRPLKFTRSDIEEFASVLKASGFKSENIVLMSDKTPELRYAAESEKIRKQLDILLAGLVEGDTLIVALAGHGVQFQGDDKSYFCPADANLDDPGHSRLLPISELYKKLKESPAQRKLLIVDACRNDPASTLGRSREALKLESITRPQVEPVPKGVVAFFSCAAGQEAFEWPELKHGVFFHHLLEGWHGAADDGDQLLTLDEIVSYTKLRTQTFARTKLDAAQTPQLKSNFEGTWILRNLTGRSFPSEVKKPDDVIASRMPITILGSPSNTTEFGLTQRKSEPVPSLKSRPTAKLSAKPVRPAPGPVLKATAKVAPMVAPSTSSHTTRVPGLVQLGVGVPSEPAITAVPPLTAAQRERNRDLVLRVRAGLTDDERIDAAREIRELGDEAEEILKTLCAGLIERNERVRMLSSQALAMINPEFHKFAMNIADERTYVREESWKRLAMRRVPDFEAQPTPKVLKFGKLTRAAAPILWSHLEKSDPAKRVVSNRSTGETSGNYTLLLDSLCDLVPEDKKLGSLLVKLIKSPNERASILAMRRLSDMPAAANRSEVVGSLMMLLQRPAAKAGSRANPSQFRSEAQTAAAVEALGKLSPYAKGARDLVRRVQATSLGQVRAAADAALRRIDEA